VEDVRRALAASAEPITIRIAHHGFQVVERSEPAVTT
jgi:hypothetical protein